MIRTILIAALMSVCFNAMAQRPECGYTDRSPDWVQLTSCLRIGKDVKILTDLVIEGSDTTRVREVVTKDVAKWMIVYDRYYPANQTCPIIELQKLVRCKDR